MQSIDRLNPYFTRTEFACKCGCGMNTVDAELLKVVTAIREYFGAPVKINSACRCPTHNKSEGGGDHSQHLLCKAADIVVVGRSAEEVADILEEWYSDRFGIGRYNSFTHIDVRTYKARWDYTS